MDGSGTLKPLAWYKHAKLIEYPQLFNEIFKVNKDKLPSISSSCSAASGEYLVLGEALKRGLEAYLAQGSTQKGWDITVIINGQEIKRVQVKTIDWPGKTAVNGKFDEGFDILAIVLLDRKQARSRFLLIPAQEIPKLLSKKNPDRQDQNRTISIGMNKVESTLQNYEDNWELFPSS